MDLSTRFIRAQLELIKPFVDDASIESARKWHERIGKLMEARHRGDINVEDHIFKFFEGAWITPKVIEKKGVILYLHGGGYIGGDLNYSKGFGSTLAVKTSMKVFCTAYRLAPENKYPAALEDAVTAYEFLLEEGYSSREIVLCGESAGGGLIYSLCLRLKELGRPLPAGLVAISPWSDLTLSGESYEGNKANDPSMTIERLDFFRNCYTEDRENPLVSPLFGDLSKLPPSLIFVGEDEIMLDDSVRLNDKLQRYNCKSELIVAPHMWHGYVLYDLKENKSDFNKMNLFLERVLHEKKKLKWMRLDNAAKIYPAAKRRNWNNVFRLSMTLKDKVEEDILQLSLEITIRRFPSIAVRLRRGMFWYYLEQIPHGPEVVKDKSYPLSRMPFDDIRKCAFRVLYYENRIAVEFFHALTDGTGGMIFLKSLVAEYISRKYHKEIPSTHGILDRYEPPKEEELEDSFLKNYGKVSMSRKESTAYRLSGTPEADGFLNNITCMFKVSEVLAQSKAYGVTLTEFIAAVMIMSIMEIQKKKIISPKRLKPVKVLIPVNLRKLFKSETLRNFVLYVTPGINPKMGSYTLEEVCKAVHHQMGVELNQKHMRARMTTNVKSEKKVILKVMPLFVKNFAMKLVYDAVGEKKSCLSISNLGAITLPEEMKEYVKRMDFVLGVQATNPNNCGVLSYGDILYINFIRNIKEPELESTFCRIMKELGLWIKVESNQR
ncbi:MAG: alpha/beta hydrolase [Clostridiaceae bacterium]